MVWFAHEAANSGQGPLPQAEVVAVAGNCEDGLGVTLGSYFNRQDTTSGSALLKGSILRRSSGRRQISEPPLVLAERGLGQRLFDQPLVRGPVEGLADHLFGGRDGQVGKLAPEFGDRVVALQLDLAAGPFEQGF